MRREGFSLGQNTQSTTTSDHLNLAGNLLGNLSFLDSAKGTGSIVRSLSIVLWDVMQWWQGPETVEPQHA